MIAEYQKLQEKINQVRRRFKWIVFAKGLVFSLTGCLVILCVAILWVDHWNYADTALSLARVFSVLFILGIFAWFLVRPLLQRVKAAQIARYIEEHNPLLQDRLVSAIELGEKENSNSSSNSLLPLLMRDALKHSRHIQAQSLFNRREPYLSGAIALGLILFFVLLQIFGPDFFQYATLRLYANWLISPAKVLYQLEVSPGNRQVRKGSDQLITAQLLGFDSQEVNLFSRYQSNASWEKSRMESQKGSNTFGFLFLDINEKVQYYVQAGNVKSPEFTLTVADFAQVEKIDLTYNFPRYTGLPAKREVDGGEISALKGTLVDVEASTNINVASARILLEDGTSLPMQKISVKKFRGRLEIKKDSAYKIELTDVSNIASIGSHEYPITALEDQPPTVTVIKPGRDKKATKLEEVLTEIKADDDFGINSLKLHFTVNGGKENVVELFQNKSGETTKSISGTHTFFLEEYNLEPGDFITYFASAADARNTTQSDIYFLEVRPFGKEYSQAQVSGGGMGSAGDVGSVLSARQKEILAATWRLIRDRKSFAQKEYTDNLKVVATSQQKLQQQTKTLSDRIQRRALATRDKEFQKLSENLIKAVEAMTPAHQLLSQDKPKDAVSPEQTALQHLMRAEAYFKEIQVAFGNGSGGQNKSLGAEELEGLFELELDKLKNQYETLQQRNSMQTGDEIDEISRKLKELAQRQQQLNERRRQAPISRSSQGSGSGTSDQQMLQAEAEKLARQLERLSRETQDEELLKASQRLKQAAQEMRENASNGSQNGQNRGLQALSRLNDAQLRLDSHQKNNLSEELKRMQAAAEELAHQQEKIQSSLDELLRNSGDKGTQSSSPNNSADQVEKDFQKKRQIFQDKTQLKKGLEAIEQSLFASARRAVDQQKSASEKLQATGNALRDNRLQEKIDQGAQLIARGLLDIAKQREQTIQGIIEDLKQKIALAGKSLDKSGSETTEEKLSKALSQTGDLIGNLESMSRRLQQFQAARSPKGNTRSQSFTGQDKKSANSKRGPTNPDPSDSANASNQETESKEARGEKPGEQGPQTKHSSGQQTQRGSQQGNSPGKESGDGQSPNGQGPSNSSQGAQAEANSNSSALGGNSPKGEPQQNALGDGEHQYHGGTNLGHGAVNFGDRELPPPGSITPEQMRQFEREYQLRLKEAQEIGRSLTSQPDLATQLKNITERMKQMGSLKFLLDEQELERLRSGVIEGFRQLELDLSKNLQHLLTKENLHLAKDEEVPEAYRKQVEDYYKALSKQR